jgi:hypothetical protein
VRSEDVRKPGRTKKNPTTMDKVYLLADASLSEAQMTVQRVNPGLAKTECVQCSQKELDKLAVAHPFSGLLLNDPKILFSEVRSTD